MIDRGTIARGFVVLLLVASALAGVYLLLADTDGSSGNFLEDDDRGWRFGAIYEEPAAYRNTVLADRWIRSMRVPGGTFGSVQDRQIRVSFEGSGPIPARDATLETPATVALFDGERRERAEQVLRGLQVLLEERDGLVKGVSLAETRGSEQAAVIAAIVRERVVDDIDDPADRRLVLAIIDEVSRQQADHAFAWYDPSFQDVVLGPEISRGLTTWIRTPGRATPEQNIFTAYVVRHELEHTVTPAGGDYAQLQWLEEGAADALARWPGAAAATARELGMPYPERYDTQEYRTGRGGYPQWTDSVRVLLGAAGVDWKDPARLDAATELLQDGELRDVPGVLAERIARRNRLTARERVGIEREIRRLGGDVGATRRLVARY